jgi:hypothetical protein
VGTVTVARDELAERDLDLGERDCIPDAAQLGTDALADGDGGSVVDGVGGEVEQAALPDSGTQYGPAGCTQARVVVGDDELDAGYAVPGTSLPIPTRSNFQTSRYTTVFVQDRDLDLAIELCRTGVAN